jgi:hypothetical protein
MKVQRYDTSSHPNKQNDAAKYTMVVCATKQTERSSLAARSPDGAEGLFSLHASFLYGDMYIVTELWTRLCPG